MTRAIDRRQLRRRLVLGGGPGAPPSLALASPSRRVRRRCRRRSPSSAALACARRAGRRGTRQKEASAAQPGRQAGRRRPRPRTNGSPRSGAGTDDDERGSGPSSARRRKARQARPTSACRCDRDYDSFDQFLDHDPALAGMVLGIVLHRLPDADPLIALIIWYKMRKNAHAERNHAEARRAGHRAPGEAMQAIGTGRVGAPFAAVAASRRWTSRRALAPPGRVVRPAQGRADGRDRPRAHALLDDRRGYAELASALCCCSWESATSSSGTSRIGQRRARAAGPARARTRRPADGSPCVRTSLRTCVAHRAARIADGANRRSRMRSSSRARWSRTTGTPSPSSSSGTSRRCARACAS